MADQLGIGAGSGPPLNAAQLQLSLDNLRALSGLLKAGEVVSGRVDQALGGDLYAFTVRGQTVVAASLMPLTTDSVLRFQVLTAVDGQLALRLIDQALTDQAVTSDVTNRAKQLGLVPGSVATAVITAFEEAGAPLQSARVQAAAVAVAAATPDQAPRLAQALAILARADLPVTDALLSLVLHAGRQTLPDAAAAVQAVQRALVLGAAAIPAGAQKAPSSASVLSASVLVATGTAMSASTTASGGAESTAGVAPPRPTAIAQSPALASPVIISPPATTPSIGAPASPTLVTTNSATAVPQVGVLPEKAVPAFGSPVVSVAVPLAGTTPSAFVASPVAPSLGVPVPALPPPLLRAELALRLLAHLQLPDAVKDGAPGVQQALALAGLRPRRGAGDEPIRPPTLVRQLAEALPAATDRAEPVSGRSDERQASVPNLGDAIVGAVREHVAETVFKPQSLADYDHVLPLPLLAQGQPTPARLAVAERQTVAGTATFVRVDAELSRLGPISVRMSGIEGGALTITLLAHGASGRVLVAGLPDLAESLRQIGVVAGLRVADLVTDDGHVG